MKTSGLIIFFYGVLILIGGIMGHHKTGSLASLLSGAIFGLLLLAASVPTFKGKTAGLYTGIFLTLVLDGFFTYRFLHTEKFLPSGLLSLLSLVVLFSLCMIARKPSIK